MTSVRLSRRSVLCITRQPNKKNGAPQEEIRATRRFTAVVLETRSGNGPARDETIDDNDHCDDEQDMNKPAANVHHEESQYPQDQQNHRNRPEH